ncbi:PTH1 family peptidyl-tRNA hydrolase [Candidatus Kinetoplastibacterium desouzaii TCC079E]|uniref:Peptidyl-tRNA hydrolase n=1 Tax=Candidatus Kinetoplastidibacterium desouzai TCC079E TaxID=1208919 RepID=M1L1L6_9PROT|nr:aminoacyl-tRNA hydrolase [Candidatus Kinetoplastibacterium desouzaii]AGF46658.1 PTH1 family peptidyl-tRNA hydrolase [Candidatus Kinetoplastibacterium desouzaii TCC079E]
MTCSLDLIVGLGNPGLEYSLTRHNAGFWLLDNMAEDLQVEFVYEKYFPGWVVKYTRNSKNLLFFKPATYMNNSGVALSKFMHYYKIFPEKTLVVHDEMDIFPGDIRIKYSGGTAGHNGLKSIQNSLNSNSFWRIRIGVGHPRHINNRQSVSDFVLDKPSKSDKSNIDIAMKHCLNLMPYIMDGNFAVAQQVLKQSISNSSS